MKILGEEYSLLFCTEEEDPALSEKYAYTDWTNKTIVVQKNWERDKDSLHDLELFKKKVLRHEIIHAFFNESGLMENSDYARNEELIDWIACQIPRMVKLMEEEALL